MPEPAAARAVLFDLDDTLYPERRFALSAFAAVADEVAHRTGCRREEIFRVLVRALRTGNRARALQALCERFGLPGSVVPALRDLIRCHRPRLRLPAPSRAALARLRAGWRLGIVTNGLPAVQARKVAALGVDSMVDVVVFADEWAPGGKPALAPFAAALGRLEVQPARAVFVGDRIETDVAGARAAGMRTLLVARRAAPAPGPLAPDRTVSTLAEVPAAAAALIADGDRHAL